MTVSEFNITIAAAGEALILPPDLEVRIISQEGSEVQIEVLGSLRWIKMRKTNPRAPKRTWEERYSVERPTYSMDKSDIDLGPTAYFVLQWINSLQTPHFSLSYAESCTGISRATIRKAMGVLIKAGRIPPREVH
jgi:hypothetical protein